MDHPCGRILDDLEAYRADQRGGSMARGKQLRRLAELRVDLLRSHRRAIALVLGEAVAGRARLDAAIDTAIVMLRSEREASLAERPSTSR